MKILLIFLPILFITFGVSFNLAVNKILFIYNEFHKAGFDLKRRTWGPTFSDTKKIAELTKDEYVRNKANESVKLWKIGFFCLLSFFMVFLVVLFL